MKDHQVLCEITHVLDSPIVLGQDVPEDNISDNSYHTPPIIASFITPTPCVMP